MRNALLVRQRGASGVVQKIDSNSRSQMPQPRPLVPGLAYKRNMPALQFSG